MAKRWMGSDPVFQFHLTRLIGAGPVNWHHATLIVQSKDCHLPYGLELSRKALQRLVEDAQDALAELDRLQLAQQRLNDQAMAERATEANVEANAAT